MAVAAPTAVTRPVRARSRSIHATSVAAGASIVFTNANAAIAFDASAFPPLNPNHPNHSRPAPRSVKGTLWGRIAYQA